MRSILPCALVLVLSIILLAKKNIVTGPETNTDSVTVVKETLEQEWDDTKWTNYKKNIATYTTGGRLVEKIEKLPVKKAWATSYRHTYAYDADGRLIEELQQDWLRGAWEHNTKRTVRYDSGGNVQEELIQLWEEDRWVNQFRITHSQIK